MILDDKLNAGELIVLDGATGSEIPNFGGQLDPVSWCGAANKHYPQAVRQVHEAYLRAGSDIITTNTFATCRHVLDGVGLGAEAVTLNTRAVELAQQAHRTVAPERGVAIAGSMSTTFAWKPGTVSPDDRFYPSKQQCEANYHELAETLAPAGVDFLLLEMVTELELGPMLAKAAAATGLPVWIGLSCTKHADDSLIAWDIKPEHPSEFEIDKDYPSPPSFDALVDTFGALQPQVMGIMHSHISATHPAIRRLKESWHGPVMAYPETIGSENGGRKGVSATPADLAEACVQLVGGGVQIIGGCCGTTIEHTRAMIRELPERSPPGD